MPRGELPTVPSTCLPTGRSCRSNQVMIGLAVPSRLGRVFMFCDGQVSHHLGYMFPCDDDDFNKAIVLLLFPYRCTPFTPDTVENEMNHIRFKLQRAGLNKFINEFVWFIITLKK
jgi:hypothetical protein